MPIARPAVSAAARATPFLLAAALMTETVTTAHAADVPATSRIDAVTVYPTGAEITRTARVRLEAGDHAVLLADLPEQTIANSIRVKEIGRAHV